MEPNKGARGQRNPGVGEFSLTLSCDESKKDEVATRRVVGTPIARRAIRLDEALKKKAWSHTLGGNHSWVTSVPLTVREPL